MLIRSNDINPDPRLQKYIDFLEEKRESFLVLGWNREEEKIEKPNHKYFHLKASYGMSHQNITNKLRWFIFVFKYLLKHKKDYHIVHSCDFDTAFPVYLSRILTRKKMIFDVFDWMSDKSNKGFLYSIIGIFEKKIFKETDYAIICEPERRKQIPVIKDNVLVMPNIPKIEFEKDLDILEITNCEKENYDIILSYVGIFDIDRGLHDLLELLTENKRVFLNIAGFGKMENEIRKVALNNDNIKFWGKVDYNRGLNIMRNSDLIIAMYYNISPVHKFAAPNKYYEGLYLGVPIVTTEKTLVGEKTSKYNTGFSIVEGKESLEDLFGNPNIHILIEQKTSNAKNLWLKEYENYIEKFLENEYYPIIKGAF